MPARAKLPQHVFAGIIHRRTIFRLPGIVPSALWYVFSLPVIFLLRQRCIFCLPFIIQVHNECFPDTDRQLWCTTGIRTPFSKGCKPFIQGKGYANSKAEGLPQLAASFWSAPWSSGWLSWHDVSS